MGLKAAKDFPGIAGFAALGLPTEAEGRHYTYPFLPACTFPKLFLSGDRDQYAPVEQLRAIVATAVEPKRLDLIPGADHFFTGHLPAMQAALDAWLRATFFPGKELGQELGQELDQDTAQFHSHSHSESL
jgi:hypothetical protein